jgi:hypothetical protein
VAMSVFGVSRAHRSRSILLQRSRLYRARDAKRDCAGRVPLRGAAERSLP